MKHVSELKKLGETTFTKYMDSLEGRVFFDGDICGMMQVRIYKYVEGLFGHDCYWHSEFICGLDINRIENYHPIAMSTYGYVWGSTIKQCILGIIRHELASQYSQHDIRGCFIYVTKDILTKDVLVGEDEDGQPIYESEEIPNEVYEGEERERLIDGMEEVIFDE